VQVAAVEALPLRAARARVTDAVGGGALGGSRLDGGSLDALNGDALGGARLGGSRLGGGSPDVLGGKVIGGKNGLDDGPAACSTACSLGSSRGGPVDDDALVGGSTGGCPLAGPPEVSLGVSPGGGALPAARVWPSSMVIIRHVHLAWPL